MKRIFLFVATNVAVLAVIAVLANVLGLDQWLTKSGINWHVLLGFSVLIGFTGSFISLAISKWIAIHAYGINVIHEPTGHTEQWLYNKIHDLAERAGIGMPDIGVYDSPEANAFATGMRRNKALVAVSTGLLHQMDSRQVEGVLAHEVAHIANGDMVTMTLLQGVLNTFVIFLSRVIGYAIDLALRRGDDRGGLGIGYFIGYYVSQILLGILASMIVMAYSRRREFRADALGAQLEGKDAMVGALWRLKQISEGGGVLDNRAASLSAMKISNKSGPNRFMRLFCSHPPLTSPCTSVSRRSAPL
jgi:heat shock protein HtpX